MHEKVLKNKIFFFLNIKFDNLSIYIYIYFKCVNSVVGPNFKEKFAEILTCGSR